MTRPGKAQRALSLPIRALLRRTVSACSDADRVIADLVAVNVESIRLARSLMLAQEQADELTAWAGRAIDRAAACASDEDAIEGAVEAAAAARDATEAEFEISQQWADHVERVTRLVSQAAPADHSRPGRLSASREPARVLQSCMRLRGSRSSGSSA